MKFREPSEYRLNTITEKVKKLKLIKKEGGNLPAIITIDGFLNQDLNNTKDWKRAIHLKFPNNAWYHLHWQSESKRTLINNSLKSILFSPYTGKTWRDALRNSEQTGKILANILINSEVNNFILIGHSLGSRVIFSCINSLVDYNVKIIYEVHLLGGAVSSNKKKWSYAERVVSNRVFNYYSKNDKVLRSLYKIGTLDFKPIGRTRIETNKAANVDVTKYVDGHLTFKENFRKYIK